MTRHPFGTTAVGARPRTARVLLLGGLVGLLVGTLLTNLGTALVEYDESQTLGAACEHAEATISGAPGGLIVGLAAAVVSLLLRPLATGYLPVFVCPY